MAIEPPDPPTNLPGCPEFRPGDDIAHYTVEGPLGGGRGRVYRARDRRTGSIAALKIMPAMAARALAAIEVTNGIAGMAETLAIGIDPDWRIGYVAMELIDGVNFEEWRRSFTGLDGRPTPAERRLVVELLLPVARGLAALHRRGHVHCDVKPSNILLERNGSDAPSRAVLGDFDALRRDGVPSVRSTLMQTPAYAAPEQVLGRRIDARTDVFSFGVTLYDLLLGQGGEQRAKRPTNGLPRLDQVDVSIDADLAAIVAECTAIEAAHRYQRVENLVIDLERWLAGRRVSVRPLSPWSSWARLCTRRPRVAGFAGVAALAFATTMIWIGGAIIGTLDASRRLVDCATAVSGGDFAAALHQAGENRNVLPAEVDCVVREVLSQLRDDVAGALRLAARYCSRDGLWSHPQLDRWFARVLRGEDAQARAQAVRLLARVLYDRPRTPDDAMPAVREALIEIAESDTGEAALFAVAAVGGLADLGVGDALLRSARSQRRRHSDWPEYLRLTVEALHRLACNTSAATASARGSCSWDARIDTQFEVCAELLHDTPGFEGWKRLVWSSLDPWFVTLACLHITHGLRPPDPTRLLRDFPGAPLLRALGGDPSFAGQLAADPTRFNVSLFDLGRLGEFAALRNEDLARLHTALSTGARDLPPDAVAQFDQGRRSAMQELRGDVAPWQPDAGSRLADEILAAPGEVPFPGNTARARTPDAIPDAPVDHRVSFRFSQPACEGSISDLVGAQVRVADEFGGPLGFCWFGSAGRSHITFRLIEPTPRHANLTIQVESQKGIRRALPSGGTAGIDLLIDDELQATWKAQSSRDTHTIPLAMTGIDVGRVHRLTLRLREDANTTLRVYSVTIR